MSEKEPGFVEIAVTIIAVAAGLFHLYAGGISAFSSMDQLAVHWMFMSVLAFLIYPASRKGNGRMKWYDVLFVIAAIAASLYVLTSWRNRVSRVGAPSETIKYMDIIMGTIMIVVVLEAARRTAGLFLPLTATVFLAYVFLGPYLPGILMHKGYSLERLAPYLLFTTEGVYGVAMGVSATFVIMFILFGAFLDKCGGGQLFVDMAFSITGRLRGGPAKASVVSSGLMGTISGSPIANAMTTGVFTVPLMIRAGYEPYIACAVEAVASTGGMIMPPIMGAAAFIMAEFLNVPYREVMLVALLPALLYYITVYFSVDLEAAKAGIVGLSSKDLPSFKQTIISRGYLLLPLFGLVYFLLRGFSPMKTVFWSILFLVVIANLRRDTRMDIWEIIAALKQGVRGAVPVATACAAAGIIVGVINLTGLGVRFSTKVVELSGNLPLAALFLTMVASIILGMGLPATAVYVVVASVVAPGLVKMGFLPIAAHLFVFYFGVISTITPPVALTAYAAAGLSKGVNPHRVGIKATAMGVTAFVIPYVFMYEPSFLLMAPAFNIFVNFIFAFIGVYFLSAGLVGFFGSRLNLTGRIILILVGFFSIFPNYLVKIVGVTASLILLWLRSKRYLELLMSAPKPDKS